jgi:SAM-dependent methyltransferase
MTTHASPFTDAAATWDQRFGADHFIFGEQPNEYLRAQSQRLRSGSRALCVADGEGRNSVWLAQQGLQVDAFDISAVGVAKARRLAARAGVAVDYAVADGDAMAWPREAYDLIAAIFIQFADPPMRARLFTNMAAALRPGGLLVLQGYRPEQLANKTGGPPCDSHLYTEALLRESFAAMEILELRSYDADLTEGTQHRGPSALIGLVARKR